MLIMAPMAGVTDLPFRLLAKEYSCDLVVSEMVSAKGLLYSQKRTRELLRSCDEERPLAIQLFGHDPRTLAQAAAIVERDFQPDMVDLNMGCPTPKIVKNGDGASLLLDPCLAQAAAKAVVESVSVPVTVKIRLGWDEGSINCVEVSKRLEEVGVHWVAVHARTRDQFYAGSANWRWIARIVEAVTIPVVGNGDIFGPEDALRMWRETGCSHLMIGRGAIGNPWIFERVRLYLETGKLPPLPSVQEKVEMAIRHLTMKMEYTEEDQAVKQMRSHLAWYLKGVPHSSAIRGALNKVETFCGVRDLLLALLE